MDTEIPTIEELLHNKFEKAMEHRSISNLFKPVDATDLKSNTHIFSIGEDRDHCNSSLLRNQTDDLLKRADLEADECRDVRVTFDKFFMSYSPCESNEGINSMADSFANYVDHAALKAIDEYATLINRPHLLNEPHVLNNCVSRYKNEVERTPDTIIVSESVYESSSKDSEYAFIDDVESLHNVDCYIDTSDVIKDDRIIVGDSSLFGYELTRTEISTRSFMEIGEPITQIFTRRAFQPILGDMCISFNA